MIVLEGVGMVYPGALKALCDIDLTVGAGEFVALVGPSGCGKSTLLRIVAGLRAATGGRVLVDGRAVTKPVAEIGMVFQAPVLLKWRTVLDNVLLPAELSGLDAGKFRARARDLLALVGLADFAGALPRQLSGGMQQRVSLCRALLLDPPLLLMDEPFGALDAMTRDEMNVELLRIWGDVSAPGESEGGVSPLRSTGESEGGVSPLRSIGDRRARKTIVFVTHSIAEAIFLADRVVVMTPRPGRVARVVSVSLPRPRTVESRGSAEFGRLTLEIYAALARG